MIYDPLIEAIINRANYYNGLSHFLKNWLTKLNNSFSLINKIDLTIHSP